MNILETFPQKVWHDECLVYWRAGANSMGILRVKFTVGVIDVLAVSELVAVRQLIEQDKIFGGVSLLSGKGLVLCFSSESLSDAAFDLKKEKLASPAVDKTDEIKMYSNYLNIVLTGVEIEIKDNSGLPALMGKETYAIIEPESVTTVFVGKHYPCSRVKVVSPRIGDLWITKNAMATYRKEMRKESGTENATFKSLIKRLRNPNLELFKLPKFIIEQKTKKYGTEYKTELWGMQTSTIKFVVISNRNNVKSLVTCYQKWNKQKYA